NANADNTVRQASSAIDYISSYAHATERNRNSLSGNSISSVHVNSSVTNYSVYTNSSVFSKMVNFFLDERYNNINTREWKELRKCQTKTDQQGKSNQ
ncbi:hypothetical protein PIROE2DRAFT_3019, partial [Piromyces sp. E2]